MKRSEMLKIIQDAVYEKFQIKVMKKDIDPILTKIEAAGMMPPEVIEEHEDWCQSYNRYDCSCDRRKLYIWESEND